MSFLHTEADLQAGMTVLVQQDPRLAPILEKTGMPALRRREGGYPGLCAIVCGQQVSTASAAAMRDRLFAAFEPFHHDTVRLARTDKLKRLGLSMAKIKSIKAIGKAISDGDIDLDKIAAMEADEAHAALTALHGIGPWTADIYLLFCLGNADAWPAGDLAVQEAVKLALDLKERPDAKEMIRLAEPWRPWRGVAAHLFWAYYHVVKRREGVLAPTPVKPEVPVKPIWPPVKAKRTARKVLAKKAIKKANGAARPRSK
jgi:DNA-3-methyladenine glycosylase II